MGEKIRMGLFACFLLAAAGQDLRKRQVSVRLLVVFGTLAAGAAIGEGLYKGMAYDWMNHVSSVSLGLGLLGIGMLTRGKIGEGDGLFFVVSGMLLEFWENLLVLSSGILLCSVFCLLWLTGKKIGGASVCRTWTVPFLPFVVAPGIYIILNSCRV